MGETPIHRAPSWVADSAASKKPLNRGFFTTDTSAGDQHRIAHPTSRQLSRTKAGPRVYGPNPTGSTDPRKQRGPQPAGLVEIWYRGGDSNPYSLWPLPPQGSVSTNSTTSAKTLACLLLLRSCRNVAVTACRGLRLPLRARHITRCRSLFLLLLHHCRIRKSSVTNHISFFFSKIR